MPPATLTTTARTVLSTDSLNNVEIKEVDLKEANIIATGLNKKSKRIVNGLGSLMGSKEITGVSVDDINSNSNADMSSNNNSNISLNTTNSASTANSTTNSLYKLLENDRNQKINASKNIHISEQEWTLSNWYNHLNWLNMILVVFMPMIGFYLAFSGIVPLTKNVAIFSIIYYIIGGASVTAGYHRLWSHRAYSAYWPLRMFYAFFAAASVQGSAKWWSHSHRIHHRYTDTNRDPYDARKGLWYSHMGWMLVIPNPKYKARADISDLNEDWIVRFQHRHYLIIMILAAFVVPSLITGYLFNDYLGGLVYAGFIRICAIQQATFCINSMAHYIGSQPYDDTRTPRDNWLTALVTFGEGYHNFHHEFPSDYRNAIKWYQYDPTKLIISMTYYMGLAYDLKSYSQNTIDEALIQQADKKLSQLRKNVNWGPKLSQLPIWDKREFLNQFEKNKNLIVISGIVHDVTYFISEHPGGQPLIKSSLGKDATKAFCGGVYRHTTSAQNILANMRVAVLRENKGSAISFASKRGEVYKEADLI